MSRKPVIEFSRAMIPLVLCLLVACLLAGAQEDPILTASPAPVRARSLLISDGTTAWDVFLRGGWCMWPILGCAIMGLAFFVERIVELRRRRQAPAGLDKDVVHVVDTRGVDSGLALCLEKQCSLSRVLYAALLRYGTSRQEMENALQDEGGRLLYDLRKNCRRIGYLASLAPLFGLVGTVWAVMQSLDTIAITPGLGSAEYLAGGVAVALLPTAFGLAVAIVLLAAYYFAKGRAEDVAREIAERGVDTIITLDRKARRSIQLIEDIEEHLETQEMAAAKTLPPDLDAEFDEPDRDKSIKTSVTTPAQLPVLPATDGSGLARKASTHGEIKAVSEGSLPRKASTHGEIKAVSESGAPRKASTHGEIKAVSEGSLPRKASAHGEIKAVGSGLHKGTGAGTEKKAP